MIIDHCVWDGLKPSDAEDSAGTSTSVVAQPQFDAELAAMLAWAVTSIVLA